MELHCLANCFYRLFEIWEKKWLGEYRERMPKRKSKWKFKPFLDFVLIFFCGKGRAPGICCHSFCKGIGMRNGNWRNRKKKIFKL